MTRLQYKKYLELENEISRLERLVFLFDTNKEFHTATEWNLKSIGKKLCIIAKRFCCTKKENTFFLSSELEKRIINVIKDYIKEKQIEIKQI